MTYSWRNILSARRRSGCAVLWLPVSAGEQFALHGAEITEAAAASTRLYWDSVAHYKKMSAFKLRHWFIPRKQSRRTIIFPFKAYDFSWVTKYLFIFVGLVSAQVNIVRSASDWLVKMPWVGTITESYVSMRSVSSDCLSSFHWGPLLDDGRADRLTIRSHFNDQSHGCDLSDS